MLKPTASFRRAEVKATSFRPGTTHEEQERSCTLLQNAARRYIGSKFRLHRSNLAERLLFESSVVWETARFVNQVLVFALLITALRLSTDEIQKRGIRVNLDEAFDFEGLQSIKSRANFVEEGLPSISEASKDFFLLSSKYFDNNGAGDKLILRDLISFKQPTTAGNLDLSGPEFSFTAWVRSDANFVKGHILRKGLGASINGAESLSCWGWYLHSAYGPQLHYGAHDFFPTDAQFGSVNGKRQEQIVLDEAAPMEAGKFALLTMSVTATHVTFYRNLQELGSQRLPKQVSDCFNAGTGIEIGSGGLELGVVRYHPTALTVVGIEELFSAGGILNDVSTGSEPALFAVSEIESLDGSVKSELSKVSLSIETNSQTNQVSFVLDHITPLEDRSPAFDTGSFAVPDSETVDLLTGRNYTLMVAGPARLTRTSTEATHRYLTNIPAFRGTGMTLSFWYRHRAECIDPNDACGLFLFAAYSDTSPSKCWALWVENTKVWYDNAAGDPDVLFKHQYMGDYVDDKYNLRGDKIWRHLTMVLDEEADEILWYIDGTFAVKAPWGSAVAEADCVGANRRLSLGHEDPGYTYGQEVEVYDLRMYVHDEGKGPLSAADIRAIASADTPELADTAKCLPIESELMEEQEWKDLYGHSCTWYADKAPIQPSVCDMPGAGDNCPISCGSRQECWSVKREPLAFWTWDGIRRIEPTSSSPNGTLCLASHLSKDEVVRWCREWVQGGVDESEIAVWLDSFSKQNGRRLDLRDCDSVAEAIDLQCSFNSSAVEEFTRRSQENNGDFTISFWMKPLGEVSFNEIKNRFIPHIQFLSATSPPKHNLAMGLWENPNGEVRVFSACSALWDNVELKTASNDEWTFVSFTRRNPTQSAKADGTVLTNLVKQWQGSEMRHCPYPDADATVRNFFTAIEVNYPVLVSPIMMVPEALPIAALQQAFLDSVKDMSVKSGPSSTGGQKEEGTEATIEVQKKEFSQPSVLIAPPILFQTRSSPQACGSSFSKSFIRSQHDTMLKGQCAYPFVCSAELQQDPSQLLACAGPPLPQDQEQFGRQPRQFDQEWGYADFLYSVTESVFLFRDGELYETSDFIDQMTRKASVLLVFFTPEADTTTVLTITADFSASSAMDVSVDVEHYEILEGDRLTTYVVVQVLVLVCIAIMLVDIGHNLKTTINKCLENHQVKQDEKHVARRSSVEMDGPAPAKQSMSLKLVLEIMGDLLHSLRELAKDLVDFSIAVMVIVYVAKRIPSKQASAKQTMEVVGGLGAIDWGNRSKSLDEKTESFLAYMTELDERLIGDEFWLNQFCNVVLVFSLLRLIKCTSMHPRLALLEGTIKKAWDDLWHSAILILLLMTCFAGIATWRFGSEREDFATFETSLQKLFEMTFGEFPEDWTDSRDLQLFTVLYIMIVFLLVQNFLLAVIVEAYMGVRKDNEDMETEQEFVTDIASSITAHWLAYRDGWPTPYQMGTELDEWKARYSVGFRDLVELRLAGQKAFRDKEAVVRFLKHYGRYEFLESVAFDDYGPEPATDGEKLAHDLEIRLGKHMGLHIPTLQEFAAENLRLAETRARERQEQRALGLPAPRGKQRGSVSGPRPVDPPPAGQAGQLAPQAPSISQKRGSAAKMPTLSRAQHPASPDGFASFTKTASSDPLLVDGDDVELSMRSRRGGDGDGDGDPAGGIEAMEPNGKTVALSTAVRRSSHENQQPDPLNGRLVWGGNGSPPGDGGPGGGRNGGAAAADDAVQRRGSAWAGLVD